MAINKQKLYELKDQRAQAMTAAEAALDGGDSDTYDAEMAKVKGFNAQIDRVERLLAEREKHAQEPGGAGDPGIERDGEGKDTYKMAVQQLAAAARKGFRVEKAAGDMMREGVDADGGYTVPEDVVTRIIKLREAKESLLGEVTIVPVKTRTGRRTFQKRSQHTGFSTVAEAAQMGKAATPQFSRLSYEIEKRRGYLPVTNELLDDSDNNIAAVVEEWLGDEARVTANKEILSIIQGQSQTDLGDLDGILSAWVKLGSAFRATSKLITNDDGLLWLGTLKDENGRYLLTPNPANPQQLRLCVGPYVLPVKTYDNNTIASTGTKIPMILGDLKAGVVYWDRKAFSVRVFETGVVGELNALEQDLTLWVGSLRDDCTLWDDAAFINGYIDTAEVAAAAVDVDDEV